MTRECKLCSFKGSTHALFKHVVECHGINKDQYLWQYVYGHEGPCICQLPGCNNKLHYSEYGRDRECCCNSHADKLMHIKHPEYRNKIIEVAKSQATRDINRVLMAEKAKVLWNKDRNRMLSYLEKGRKVLENNRKNRPKIEV